MYSDSDIILVLRGAHPAIDAVATDVEPLVLVETDPDPIQPQPEVGPCQLQGQGELPTEDLVPGGLHLMAGMARCKTHLHTGTPVRRDNVAADVEGVMAAFRNSIAECD